MNAPCSFFVMHWGRLILLAPAEHTLYHYDTGEELKMGFNCLQFDDKWGSVSAVCNFAGWACLVVWMAHFRNKTSFGSSYSIIVPYFNKSFRYHRWTPQKIEWHFINDLHEESVTLAAAHELIFCNCSVIIRIKSVKYLLGPLHWIKSLTIPEKWTRCFFLSSF